MYHCLMILRNGYSLSNIGDISSLQSSPVLLVQLYAFINQVFFLLLLNCTESCTEILLDINNVWVEQCYI